MSAPGYWIARVTVTDPEGYAAYRAAAAPAIAAEGGRLLVLGGAQRLGAGQARPQQVVVAFPDLAAALRCHDGAAYQATLALRDASAEVDLVIVEGLAPTAA
jgi:uncharacterized protein (DUF1330 family)